MSQDDEARRRRREAQRKIGSRYGDLTTAELATGAEESLEGVQQASFLGTYSAEGLRRALEHYGLFALVEARGYTGLELSIDTSDPFLHGVRIRDGSGLVLVEMRARLSQGSGPGAPDLAPLTFLEIEWLSAEDPRRNFSLQRPPLPGQRHPGLGIGAELEELMALMARRLGAAGVMARPQWFHNAAFYHPRFRFADAAQEGRFSALLRDLSARSLPLATWAVALGCVVDGAGQTYEWKPDVLLLSRSREVDRHFDSSSWRRTRNEAKTAAAYRLDDELLKARLAERGLTLVR